MTTDFWMNIWAVCAIIYLIANVWPHKDIIKFVGAAGRPMVYLRRYYFWRSEWSRRLGWKDNGNKYLHIILRSDDDYDPHNHPWNFRIKVLWGGYVNELWLYRDSPDKHGRGPGRFFFGHWPVITGAVRFRSADYTHRVVLHENKSIFMRMLFGQFKPAVTFVQTGPIKQHWSFITEKGLVPHWEYLGLPAPVQPVDDNI